MAGRSAACERLWSRLLAYSLSYPEAWEDHPWEETVAKVRTKIFVFFGSDPAVRCLGLTVKVPESAPVLVSEPFASPAGYNLGKSGWVSLRFDRAADVPMDLLEELIDESYRAVAPKRLIAQLDARADDAGRPAP